MHSNSQNILMIGWEYPPHNSGGLGVACQGLTQAMADDQTKIKFTLPYNMGSKLDHMEVLECVDPAWLENVTALDNPPFEAYANLKNAQFLRKLKINSHQLASLPNSEMELKVSQYAHQVNDQVSNHKTDFGVIHAHDWMSFPAAERVKRETGKPMVAHIHSTEFDRIPDTQGSRFIATTEARGFKVADQIIAVSYYTKKLLIDKYGVDPQKISVVHNGILPSSIAADPGKHHFAQKRPVVVFMGRLTSQKGPFHFLELAKKVTAQIPEALLVMAGNGDLYRELLLSAAGSGLSSKLLFTGFVRDKQREKLLDRADVFVMPSLSEPFGLVALEAAQKHTPVIISKTSGVREVLPSAIALDFWDIEQMSEKIVELLKDEDHSQSISKAQLSELEKVTWQSAAQKVKQIYRKAFEGKG